MSIISISLPDPALAELDQLQKATKLGRSELIRAALNAYGKDNARTNLENNSHYTGSLTIVVAETQKRAVHDAIHQAQSLVRTQSHLCVDADRCMELLGIHGAGSDIISFLETIDGIPKVSKISLIAELCSNHKH